jgi:methionine synthase II (cobalamin-independent)
MDLQPFTKEMAIGIVDAPRTSSSRSTGCQGSARDPVRECRQALPHLDCGLKTRPVEESIAKCKVVVEAARVVRKLAEKVSRLGAQTKGEWPRAIR